jgi:hypothetical protein
MHNYRGSYGSPQLPEIQRAIKFTHSFELPDYIITALEEKGVIIDL